MATQMPPPSPRTEKRRLTGAAEELEVLASPSKRGTPTSRTFFSTGPESARTPADVSWIREQAGNTPRALDREFVEASSSCSNSTHKGGLANNNGRGSSSGNNTAGASSTAGRSKMYNRRTWTKEENEQLQRGISSLSGPQGEIGKNEWNAIANDFLKNSRTGTQCATHWKMVLKPALLKGVWSAEEDAVIYDSVARGVTDWNEVAALLPKRKAKHCRERWNNHLDPALSNAEWTLEEEAKLVSAVEAHGTSWTHIARLLPGRSETMIRQHWNAIVFRNAASAGGIRRGRSRAEPGADGAVLGCSGPPGIIRGRSRPSTLPIEVLPQPPLHDPSVREGRTAGEGGGGSSRSGSGGGGQAFVGGQAGIGPAAMLTEREKALMDHAFKTGLTAAATGGAGVGVASPEVIEAISKGGGIEHLTLTTTDDDVFAPLNAALLKGEGSDIVCSSHVRPPSPTTSPLKPQKRTSDVGVLGHELADAWVADEDPALADLYRSLDNIGESLFNEDNFELSFDFDSVDKPAPSASSSACAPAGDNSPAGDQPSCSGGALPLWDNLLPDGQGQKEVSPFRRAAAQAAATLEKQRLSSTKQAQGLQAACHRAAAAAVSAAQRQGQNLEASSAPASSPAPDPGPRVKQGFIRLLLLADYNKFGANQPSSYAPFATIRGCLSEANASPLPIPVALSDSPAQGKWAPGGENRLPWRRQRLSAALFALPPSGIMGVGEDDVVAEPVLKHGKAEVQIPRPVLRTSPSASRMGAELGPLCALPTNRFNNNQQEGDDEYGWPPEEQGGQP